MRKALSPRELGFAKRNHNRLAKALREEPDVRTFRRVQAVLMVAEDHDMATAAHLTGFSRRSLYYFVARYLGARDEQPCATKRVAGVQSSHIRLRMRAS